MAEPEVETTGLKELIKHHRSRPSYARMISWEFSKSGSDQITQPRRRRRSKRNKSGNSLVEEGDGKLGPQGEENDGEEDDAFIDKDGIENASSTDDSEYHSAEEHLTDSDPISRSSSISDSEVSELAASFQTCRTNDEVMDESESVGDFRNPVVDSERKRAPSKKQKRKRKKSRLSDGTHFFLDDLPFANFQEFDIVEDESMDNVCVLKPVPSLLDLCMQACRNLNSDAKSIMPRSLKSSMSGTSSKFHLEKTQLSWLYSLLTDIEVHFDDLIGTNKVKHWDGGFGVYEKNLYIPSRNVWTIHHYHNRLGAVNPGNDDVSYKAGLLPFTHAVDYYQPGFNGLYCTKSILALSSK